MKKKLSFSKFDAELNTDSCDPLHCRGRPGRQGEDRREDGEHTIVL